jgi:hypothetical protein
LVDNIPLSPQCRWVLSQLHNGGEREDIQKTGDH